MPMLRLVLFTLLSLLVLVAVIGCDDGREADDGSLEASGVVVEVRGTLTAVDSFDMLLEDGTRLTFVPEAGALENNGFSPAHLREHSALAQPIAVRYREEDGVNVVTGVGDAE